MNIPERVKKFIKKTNSFCIIMNGDEPEYILASFEWAERMMIPPDETDMAEANSDISLAAIEDETEDF